MEHVTVEVLATPMSEFLQSASSRAHHGVAYAGEVSPQETWNYLNTHQDAVLVDVRTPPEWAAGSPDIEKTKKQLVQLEWKLYPNYTLNEKFVPELCKAISDKQVALFFLCRSGGRSLDAAAAMTAEGYLHCFNVTGGFEGSPGAQNQRGDHTGWKAAKLPWRQS